MSYAFNDDKSKFDLEDLAKVKVIYVTEEVNANSHEVHTVNSSVLSNTYSIDDISDYAILSVNFSRNNQDPDDPDNRWNWKPGPGFMSAYGEQINVYATTNNPSDGDLLVSFENDYGVSATITARIMLLKLPE